MTDRREFLQAGLAASIVAGTAMRSAGAEGLWPGRGAARSLHAVLVDAALPEGARFGQQGARRGVPVHAVEHGDFSDYWYQQLDPLWRRQRAHIAGLTRHGPLFVLERLAWDRGMRVRYRGEHFAAGGERWAHRLSGSAGVVDTASDRIRAGSDWVVALAGVVLRTAPAGRQATADIGAAAPGRSAHESLFSWVIA